jgi:hypothetical protein
MSTTESPAWLPRGIDLPAALLVVAGLVAMFWATTGHLASTVWVKDEQGHGPIIFAVVLWLLFGKRHEFAALPAKPSPLAGTAIFVFGLLIYVLGRSQAILMFEVGALIPLLVGLIL